MGIAWTILWMVYSLVCVMVGFVLYQLAEVVFPGGEQE